MADVLKDLFERAVELPPDQRAHFVEHACADRPELRCRLDALLSAHDDAGDFLEHPTDLVDAITAAARDATELPAEHEPGDHVDRFVLCAPLGRGGFGSVWRARQQTPVEREVALKILHARLDAAPLAEAFHAERQSLARMRHPAIAKVFDAGVADGRPWLAMELVDGQPIVGACEARGLDLRTRLALFTEVCRALQYAHGKGVVHRDLKPSNVLLTEDDGRLRPVVIDFGIAGSLEQAPRGAGPFGTPEYMSPEQATQDDGGDVDIRTDVHALGVLLYELVARSRPFARTHADEGPSEILRRVREHMPTPPSRAPSALPRVPRELDRIVEHALAKDPADRYPTAIALAEDVERLLRHEPISLREGHAGYRLRKFVRRHRVAVGAVLTILVASTTAAVVATRGWLAASAAEQSARRALDVLDEIWMAADTSRFGRADYPVRELFLDFERALPGLVRDEPAVEYRVRLSMARLQRAIGEFGRALRHAERAVELARRLEPRARAEALLELGRVQFHRNEAAAAASTAHQGLAEATKHTDVRLLAELHALIADASFRTGSVDAALAAAERSVELRRRSDQARERAHGQMLLASLHGSLGRVDVALSHLREAEALLSEGPADLADVLVARQHMAVMLQRRGDLREAEATMRDCFDRRREFYGAGHPIVASTASDLGWMLHELQRYDEAEQLLATAVDDLRARLGEDHVLLTEATQRLGAAQAALGRFDDAERNLRTAQQRYRTLAAHPPEGLVGCMGNLASLLWTRGERAAAADVLAEALQLAKERLPADHFVISVSLTNYAYMQHGLGKPAEAVTLLTEALRLSRAAGRDGEARVQRRRLIEVLRQLGRDDEADRIADDDGEGSPPQPHGR